MKEGEDMAKVIHVLSDGTVVDSIEGMVIPAGHRLMTLLQKHVWRKNRRKPMQRQKERDPHGNVGIMQHLQTQDNLPGA